MEYHEKRKFKRFNVFCRAEIKDVPGYDKKHKVIGWTKNVSQEGLSVNIYPTDNSVINYLVNLIERKEHTIIELTLPNNFCIEAECQTIRGFFFENKISFNLGLKILKLNPQQEKIWLSFIETLPQNKFSDQLNI